jgi:hypothetical protein
MIYYLLESMNNQLKDAPPAFGAALLAARAACHPWNSGIWPGVYRPFEFVIPGTTDTADEMVRHIRHRQPLRQSKRQSPEQVGSWNRGPLRYRYFPRLMPGAGVDGTQLSMLFFAPAALCWSKRWGTKPGPM